MTARLTTPFLNFARNWLLSNCTLSRAEIAPRTPWATNISIAASSASDMREPRGSEALPRRCQLGRLFRDLRKARFQTTSAPRPGQEAESGEGGGGGGCVDRAAGGVAEGDCKGVAEGETRGSLAAAWLQRRRALPETT